MLKNSRAITTVAVNSALIDLPLFIEFRSVMHIGVFVGLYMGFLLVIELSFNVLTLDE